VARASRSTLFAAGGIDQLGETLLGFAGGNGAHAALRTGKPILFVWASRATSNAGAIQSGGVPIDNFPGEAGIRASSETSRKFIEPLKGFR
jgi:hypothetical protein